jgi:PmbA protein
MIAKNTMQQLERARKIAPAPEGLVPVIFTPDGVVGSFAIPLAMAINGKTVLQGASPLGNRKGQQVFDGKLSIYDDATVDYRPGSRVCDDEGVPSRYIPIIEKGVVANFLYDLQTAGLAGTQSTGSASRALASLPNPSMSGVVINSGEVDFEDMLAGIKEGLVIEQLMGASQGNVLAGDFSGNVLLGYLVRNGEIVGRVKDTMVSGNIYDVLKEIDAIGRKGKWVGGRVHAPHIYCSRLAVSRKK